MSRRTRKVSIVVACAIIMSGGLYALFRPNDKYKSAAHFRLDYWRGVGDMLIRLDSNGDLLFRHLASPERERGRHFGIPPAAQSKKVIYRFAPLKNELTPVSGDEWDEVDSVIADCSAQQGGMMGRLKHVRGYKLTFDGVEIPTAGKSVLQTTASPSGKYAAILSASGSGRNFGAPFGGECTARGTRYHQVFRIKNGESVGEPVILQEAPKNIYVHPCWSPDEEYIVYAPLLFNELWIIPAPGEIKEPNNDTYEQTPQE